jgi:hypothetical protein
MELSQLSKEFPREAVHWRAQSLKRDGTKALALAYIDARDVQDRLDEVCGPQGWQTELRETAKGRIICSIGVKIGDEWVWKADGAGATDIEGDKGGISDAFKRSAVHWGIGRYLYRMKSPWVPCETYQNSAGKKIWSKWTADPWAYVSGNPPADPKEPTAEEKRDRLKEVLAKAQTQEALDKLWKGPKFTAAFGTLHPAMQAELTKVYTEQQGRLHSDPAGQAPDPFAETIQ